MKNLFKNLMLVAVAAMAFVACSQEGIEVNNLTKKTIVEGIASINTDDTRSGFVGSETDENGKTVYKSAWDGGENIKVFATDYGLETTAKINEDGKFTAEFDGELPEKYFIAVCSPAEAWVSAYTCNIPTVQTPRTDSVDPAAHILSQQGIYVSNGSADPFTMQHQVGYGKMTVNTPAEFVIDYVEVELNGDWYGARTLKYTINADNVKDNVFWFATDVVEVSDFTVKAYDAEGNAYTKSVTIPEGRELKFQYGRVSTFSVSNLEKYEYVAYISASYDGWSGYFGFTIDSVDGARLFPRLYIDAVSNMIPEGTHTNPSWVSNHGFLYEDYANYDGYSDFSSCTYAVEWLENGGYKIDFQLTAKNGKVYEFAYSGVINGICNPPAPDAVTVETVATSVTGSGSNRYFTLNLTTESYLFNQLWFDTLVESNIIADGTFNASDATVTYLDENGNDSGWEFGVSGTITVAHDPENQQYNLTFNLEDANGSTFVVTYIGKIDGIYSPGEATPLNSPSNISYELENFTDAVITWNAVEGAGNYELYYEYWDNNTSANIKSDTVTTTGTSYTFEGLTPGIYYTIFVKALPSTSANTESEYARLYDVIVYSAPDSMSTAYTFSNADNIGNNKIRFSDADGNNAVIAFNSSLTEINAGLYHSNSNDYSYNIDTYNCKFNNNNMYPFYYVLVEGNPGETQTVTIVASTTDNGEVVKSVFTGVINMEPTLEYTSATIAYDGSNLNYNFTGDGIGLYFNYYAYGAAGIAEGTYTFTSGTHYSSYYTYTYDYQYMSSIDLTVTGAIGETQTYEFVLHTEYAGDIKAKYTGVLQAQ